MTEPAALTVYGADWCADCRRSKAVLDSEGADYRWIDVDAVEGAAGEALAISGRTSIPLIVFPDGSHLVEPSDEVLRTRLAGV
jgi:mycoredoxin